MNVQEAINEVLEELETLNVKCKNFVTTFRGSKTRDQLLLAKSVDIQDRDEEVLVQKLVDLLEPVTFTGSEVEKVRLEMQTLEAQGHEIRTPEEENAWEKRLQDARQADFEKAEKIKADRMAGMIPSPDHVGETVVTTKAMSEIKGLGANSIAKLQNAGINTPEEFYALSFEQKREIVGPLVASKFKSAQ